MTQGVATGTSLTDVELRASPVGVSIIGTTVNEESLRSINQIMEEVLIEMRMLNQYMYRLPEVLNSGIDPSYLDEPDRVRNEFSNQI